MARHPVEIFAVALGLAVVGACGGSQPSGSGEGAETTAAPSTTGTGTGSGESTGTTNASASATGSSSGSSTGADTTTTAATSESASPTEPLFDVGGGGTTGSSTCENGGGGGGGGGVDFSYIWIANSPAGTLSKIDTQTMVEEGRYPARPQGGGDPSRTSVNLDGDVVVASRLGGVTKVFAQAEDCVDDIGVAGLQTSSGAGDVLAFADEECIAWHTPFDFISERAIAWTAGEFDEATCSHTGTKVWVGATSDANDLVVLRLDGEDGVVEDQIEIPGTTGLMERSPYGGAVDLEGDFWMVNSYCNASLVEVRADLTYDVIVMPVEVCAYGIAVDAAGYVWIGGYQQVSARYDPESGGFDLIQAQGLGIQEDASGRLWLGAYGQNGVYEIDGDTLQVLSYTALPTTGQSKGVSIDFFGYVWVVSDAGNTVVRMDPADYSFEVYAGLDQPYSYSDMTGWGLANVANPRG